MSHLLEIKNLHYYYGQIHAVKGIDFYVDEGEIVTLVGSNGAGKSTTVNTIAGLLKANGITGKIEFDGEDITKKSGHEICKKGIMTVIEGRKIFSQLTVYENLLMGAYIKRSNDIGASIEDIFNLFPKLKERRNQNGGTLSGGEQQMLAIARALINKPRMILMDEPSLGLAPVIVEEIFEIIKKINRESKTTILLIEQNSQIALNISNRAYVLQNGKIVVSGNSKDLANNDSIKRAYLGM